MYYGSVAIINPKIGLGGSLTELTHGIGPRGNKTCGIEIVGSQRQKRQIYAKL